MAFNASDSFGRVADSVVGLLPAILGALVVLVLGYIIAKAVQSVLDSLLAKTKLNHMVESSPAGRYLGNSRVSHWIARFTFWVIMLGTISLAVSILGISALTAVLAAVYAYLPNVVAAALIFIVAVAVSAGVGAVVSKTMGETPTGKLVASIVPGLIMSIAVFMILTQLKIATEIVTITFAALMGSIALGSALAFGLGGRDVAGRMLEGAYSKGQDMSQQARKDFATGRQRAEAKAHDLVAAAKTNSDVAMPTSQTQAQPTFGERIEQDENDRS